MSDFGRCQTCGVYGFLSGRFADHKCPPAFECRMEWHSDDDDAWERVYATDAESAAEKFAERYDCEGGEYAIVSGRGRNEPIVQVRPAPAFEEDPEPFERWSITAETVPQYRADKIEPEEVAR